MPQFQYIIENVHSEPFWDRFTQVLAKREFSQKNGFRQLLPNNRALSLLSVYRHNEAILRKVRYARTDGLTNNPEFIGPCRQRWVSKK